MADIFVNYASGNTLYAVVFNSAGQVNVAESSDFEDWGTSGHDADDYDYTISEVGTGGGVYVAEFPAYIPSAGRYRVAVFLQAGANPADGDMLIGAGVIVWDSSREVFGFATDGGLFDEAAVDVKTVVDQSLSDYGANEKIDAVKAETALILEDTGTTLPGLIVAAAPVENVPNEDSIVNTGSEGTTSYTDCASDNEDWWEITDAAAAENEPTIDVTCAFNIGSSNIPIALAISGYFNRSGAGGYVVEIYAYNYVSETWDKLSTGTKTTEMRDNSSNKIYEFSLNGSYMATITEGDNTKGDVKIRFQSTRLENEGGDVLYLDYVTVSSISIGALSPEVVADAVWAKSVEDIRDGVKYRAGHVIKGLIALGTSVATEDTENTATSFTLTDGIAADDAYNGMLLQVKDESADNREVEVRKITDWTSDKVVTVDRAFSFIPTVGDHVHVIGCAYIDGIGDDIKTVAGAVQVDVKFLQNVAEGDIEIDTTTTPWQAVVKIKSTDTELIRKNLKDKDGNNITSVNAMIGRYTEPS